jgi:two-component system cell cycle sensor histidine kinase/response regulator CckA
LDAICSLKAAPNADTREWPQPPHRPIPARKGNGILVIDNEPGIRRLLEIAFTQRGYQVWLASNGEEGAKLFDLHRQDIAMVLIDVVMPILDGPGTLEALRRIDPQVLCCFMTGNGGEYTLEHLENLGAVRIFTKPFVLREILETALQLTQAQAAPTDVIHSGR